MKKYIALFAFITVPAMAETVQQADALFSARTNGDDGITKARKAADIYADLAEKANTITEKAELKMKETEAVYFLGNRVEGKKNILATFERGYKAARFAAENLAGAQKAEALYWYAANQGRWGETKGILSALSRWRKEMKPALEEGIKLAEDVQDYGLFRTSGKAFLKVPGEDRAAGYERILKAYTNTLTTVEVDGEEIETSRQPNNTLFLLFAITKRNMDVEETNFCEIYDNTEMINDAGKDAFMMLQQTEGARSHWTDFEKEFDDLFNARGDFEDVVNYYDENC